MAKNFIITLGTVYIFSPSPFQEKYSDASLNIVLKKRNKENSFLCKPFKFYEMNRNLSGGRRVKRKNSLERFYFLILLKKYGQLENFLKNLEFKCGISFTCIFSHSDQFIDNSFHVAPLSKSISKIPIKSYCLVSTHRGEMREREIRKMRKIAPTTAFFEAVRR